jgi:hypothetical protein
VAIVLEMTVAVAETVAAIVFGLSLFSYAAVEIIIPAAKGISRQLDLLLFW